MPEYRYVKIPISETHRGVGIQKWQSARRVEVVKAEIDIVFEISDEEELFTFLRKDAHSPEARQLAAAKLKATHQIAVQERRARPKIDMEMVEALGSGLDCLHWMSRRCYGSLLDHHATERDEPVPKAEVEAAMAAGEAELPARDEG
jgi:hypothetical protein